VGEGGVGVNLEFTILMPCLNEAETLAVCINKARSFLTEHGISGEVLIADNGSTDGSQKIAKSLGARVVDVPERGYGAALIGGCNAAYGKYVIMGDADDSYDFTNLMPFVERLRAGDDLVMGNRFKGGIKKGAMPPLHRYLGNPVLSGLGRIFFRCPIRDFHCGLRGYNTERIRQLNLLTTGMEYASEMVVQATINRYKISEVPTTLSPDGRSRPPHLRSWRDGWRHLKFLLMYTPNWSFFVPGLFCFLAGLIASVTLIITPVKIGVIGFDVSTLVYMIVLLIMGVSIISCGVISKVYAIKSRFIPASRFIAVYDKITANSGALMGAVLIFTGLCGGVAGVLFWREHSFGAIDPRESLRIALPSLALIVIGVQVITTAFLMDIIRIKTRHSEEEKLSNGKNRV
jgi:glycosyltransferase involved in cell wall biosynthesis